MAERLQEKAALPPPARPAQPRGVGAASCFLGGLPLPWFCPVGHQPEEQRCPGTCSQAPRRPASLGPCGCVCLHRVSKDGRAQLRLRREGCEAAEVGAPRAGSTAPGLPRDMPQAWGLSPLQQEGCGSTKEGRQGGVAFSTLMPPGHLTEAAARPRLRLPTCPCLHLHVSGPSSPWDELQITAGP